MLHLRMKHLHFWASAALQKQQPDHLQAAVCSMRGLKYKSPHPPELPVLHDHGHTNSCSPHFPNCTPMDDNDVSICQHRQF